MPLAPCSSLSSCTRWAIGAGAEPGPVLLGTGVALGRTAGAAAPRALELRGRGAWECPVAAPVLRSPRCTQAGDFLPAPRGTDTAGAAAPPPVPGGPPPGAPRVLCKWCRQADGMLSHLSPALSLGPREVAQGPPLVLCPWDGWPAWQDASSRRVKPRGWLSWGLSLAEEMISCPRGSRAWLTLSLMLSCLVRTSQSRSPLPWAPGAAPRGAPALQRAGQGQPGGARGSTPAPGSAPARAGSQGIPYWGLDFPAAMAPITATESFSIKPATDWKPRTGVLLAKCRQQIGAAASARLPMAHLSHR